MNVKRMPHGSCLEPNYFLQLLQFCGSESRQRYIEERVALLDKRRVAYKSGDDKKYSELVLEEV